MAIMERDVDILKFDEVDRFVDLIESRYSKGEEPWKALRITWNDLEGMEKCAERFFQELEYRKSLDIYLLLATLKPLSRYWICFAEVAIAAKEIDEALQALGAAALVDSNDATPHLIAGQCYLEAGRVSEAVQALCAAKTCGISQGQMERYQELKGTIFAIPRGRHV
jgi:tetratricopeptide (TPR) repeat protein